MILYELAVNAARHGALARPDGRVEITWTESGGDATLRWIERSSGKALTPPERIGRGTHLIRGFAGHELRGEVTFDYRPGGLAFTLKFPIEQVSHAPPA
jgi:two-component sensor histidine kinase